jgi:small subunit ribosomal protein S9
MVKDTQTKKESNIAKEEKEEKLSDKIIEKKENKKAVFADLKGKYIQAVGRRKTSVAQVRLYEKGKGNFLVNNEDLEDYFSEDRATIITQPLKLTSHLKDLDFSVLVKGGGSQGQAEAVRLGIARALIALDKDLMPTMKAKSWNTRDDRRKERKKPGLKKARRAPQWSKR